MKFDKILSPAKINLSLNVLKRLSNNYHKIESLVTFIELSDEIYIRLIKNKFNKISFSGKFSKGINKNHNTITKLLKILKEKNLILNKKFEIKIKKNIPQKSGMGGGSMNAANILIYLKKKKIIKTTNSKINEIAKKIGSDVILGLERKNSILFKNGDLSRLNCKTNFYVLITKPNIGCNTEKIYSSVRKFTKSQYTNKNRLFFNIKNLVKSNNNLETVVLKKYPKIKSLKKFLMNLPDVIFVRMTGSGSSIVAYFKTRKKANYASRIFMRKYKNYWLHVSKTI
tara:strand:- start:260 stop:1111 length:852 start_codon:yes stop_codon:yes gene_type:complete